MKRGTPQHPKVSDLASRLKVELYAAVGLLEMLWHFAGDYAPQGDIGRHTDESIAKALRWKKNPAILVQALTDSRWIDSSESHRLIVHDWRDHCDDAVHMKLARARQTFCDGSAPKLKRLPTREREDAERFYSASREYSVRTENTHNAHYGEGVAKAKAKASEEEPKPEVRRARDPVQADRDAAWSAAGPYDPRERFEEFWRRYPQKVNKQKAFLVWDMLSQQVGPVQFEREVDAGLDAHEGCERWARGVYHDPDNWLREHRNDRPAMPMRPKSALERQLENLHVEEEPE